MRLVNHNQRHAVLRVPLFVNERYVEGLAHEGRGHFEHCLCEGLTEANAFASVEGEETHWVALGATWSQRERVRRVEAFGKELIGSLPLVTVTMQSNNVNIKGLISLDMHASDLCVALKAITAVISRWRVFAKRLVQNITQVIKVLSRFKCKIFKASANDGLVFLTQALDRVWVKRKMRQYCLSRVLGGLSAGSQEIYELINDEIFFEDLRASHH